MRPRPGRRPPQYIAKSAPQALRIMNRSSRGVTKSGAGSIGADATTGAAAATGAGAAAAGALATAGALTSACRQPRDNVLALRLRQAIDSEPPAGMPAQCTR